jgi:hypothetical protein
MQVVKYSAGNYVYGYEGENERKGEIEKYSKNKR